MKRHFGSKFYNAVKYFAAACLMFLLVFPLPLHAQEPVTPPSMTPGEVPVPGSHGKPTPSAGAAAPAETAPGQNTASSTPTPAKEAPKAVETAPLIVDPFSPAGVVDTKAAKDTITRTEVLQLLKESEAKLREEILLQTSQQSVDTKQLTDLLGSLAETSSIEDMAFVGCVNNKAVYRTKDGATIVVQEGEGADASPDQIKPLLSIDRCSK